jgi:alkylhydroperoxidase/carboxymuconolactone decarboxylase family protein YurZ
MDDKERYERGMTTRRKVLGNAWVDQANAKRTPLNQEFQDFPTRTAWGEVWTRPHYDERTRRILVIGTDARARQVGRVPHACASAPSGSPRMTSKKLFCSGNLLRVPR